MGEGGRLTNAAHVARTDGDRGWRVGEGHHNATVPDAIVHEFRDLIEHKHMRIRQAIEFLQAQQGFTLKYRTARKIAAYQRRCHP